MHEAEICRLLVEKGREQYEKPRQFTQFSPDEKADRLLNDLEGHPHALVVACLMDRQVPAEQAWMAPQRLAQKLGDLRFVTLEHMSREEASELMLGPPSLHRFPGVMAENLYLAIQRITAEYGGDAGRIWAGEPPSAEVVCRFLRFRGVAPRSPQWRPTSTAPGRFTRTFPACWTCPPGRSGTTGADPTSQSAPHATCTSCAQRRLARPGEKPSKALLVLRSVLAPRESSALPSETR
jgi:hypothetical protein